MALLQSSMTQPKYQRGAFGQQPGAQTKPAQPGILGQQPQQPAMNPLQPQAPMTQAGGLAQQKNLTSLQTGQFGEVQSAQAATTRANALRQYQAIQSSRGNAVRNNLSTEQAQRSQDESLAAANSSNLAATNSVNALQRQYGQDALNRADTYENQAYTRGTAERGYQDSRSDLGYDRATDAARYGDTRADVKYGQEYQAGRDAVGDQRYGQEYQDSRADLGYNRTRDESRYADTRADVKYGQEYQAGRDQVGDKRYDAATAYSQGRDQVSDARYDQTYADSRGDKQYDRTYQEGRDQVGDQRYDQQYSDTRGDVQYQRGYQENRDQVGDARYADATQYDRSRDVVGDARYDQTYADQRGDTLYQRGEDARLEGKGDLESLISSVQDPKAQNLLRSVQASGGDVKATYQNMMDNGTIKEEYRSSSPGTMEAQAKIDELKSYYPKNAGESDADYSSRIQAQALQEREQERAAIQKPLADATNKAAGEEVLNILANGGTPSEPQIQAAIKSGAIPTISQANLPIGSANETKFSQEYGGKMINIGGTAYKVEPQASTFGSTNVSVPVFVNSQSGERMTVDGGALKVIPKTSILYRA